MTVTRTEDPARSQSAIDWPLWQMIIIYQTPSVWIFCCQHFPHRLNHFESTVGQGNNILYSIHLVKICMAPTVDARNPGRDVSDGESRVSEQSRVVHSLKRTTQTCQFAPFQKETRKSSNALMFFKCHVPLKDKSRGKSDRFVPLTKLVQLPIKAPAFLGNKNWRKVEGQKVPWMFPPSKCVGMLCGKCEVNV